MQSLHRLRKYASCCHPEPFAVILSGAKDLALRIFMAMRDASSPAAPHNDRPDGSSRSLLSPALPPISPMRPSLVRISGQAKASSRWLPGDRDELRKAPNSSDWVTGIREEISGQGESRVVRVRCHHRETPRVRMAAERQVPFPIQGFQHDDPEESGTSAQASYRELNILTTPE